MKVTQRYLQKGKDSLRKGLLIIEEQRTRKAMKKIDLDINVIGRFLESSTGSREIVIEFLADQGIDSYVVERILGTNIDQLDDLFI